MGLSIWHLIIILLTVFLLFGAGKIPRLMGDIGKGMRNLRRELDQGKEEQELKDVTREKRK